MSNHGPLFDEFPAQSGEHHGGALADEYSDGPRANAGTAAVTETYRQPVADGSGHGARWDEFGWRELPEKYGRMMDSNFREEVALDGGEHGTWMDVFRGGTQVRVDVDGIAGLEGSVIECHGDHAVVELRRPRHADGGGRVEVALPQIREWRRANELGTPERKGIKAATPGNTPAGPVAGGPKGGANGGGRSDLDTDAGQESVAITVKTLDDSLADVRKLAAELEDA